MGVPDGVRMRKEITYRQPDFAIVRVFRERISIIQAPRTNRAALQDELHRLFRVESDASLLDFTVRQKPDQRFVVKIDNLDPIAPQIAKITAKRRFQFQFVFLR
jgi:hypothetical protein